MHNIIYTSDYTGYIPDKYMNVYIIYTN